MFCDFHLWNHRIRTIPDPCISEFYRFEAAVYRSQSRSCKSAATTHRLHALLQATGCRLQATGSADCRLEVGRKLLFAGFKLQAMGFKVHVAVVQSTDNCPGWLQGLLAKSGGGRIRNSCGPLNLRYSRLAGR